MRTYSWIGLFVVALAAGCATQAGTGALAGGAIGAGSGALIGSATGHPGVGALLGSGIGAMTGSLVGAGMDEVDRKNQARIAAATAQPSNGLSVTDIISMSRSGVAEETIIATIRSSPTSYALAAADVISLHNQGVSDRVIQAMLDSSRRPAVMRPVPVVYEPAPVYFVQPPPPRIAVGFGYGYGRHCW